MRLSNLELGEEESLPNGASDPKTPRPCNLYLEIVWNRPWHCEKKLPMRSLTTILLIIMEDARAQKCKSKYPKNRTKKTSDFMISRRNSSNHHNRNKLGTHVASVVDTWTLRKQEAWRPSASSSCSFWAAIQTMTWSHGVLGYPHGGSGLE